jgi:ATP-dependent helicase/nuclease subunit A
VSTTLSLFDENRYVPPRQLVLASAGSGKTFRISSGIIALLARGEAPDDIFASTFTRKAAGEILDRVLLRLAVAALEPKEARELAVHAGLIQPDAGAAAAREYDGTFWARVLQRSVRKLHRMNIGTLDAFFLRIVAAFGHELGMPTQWNIGDETTAARLRSLALQDVLRSHDASVLLPLIRAITRNPLTRSLHDGLLRKLKTLVAVHHALDPSMQHHWSGFDAEAQGADEAALETARLLLAARVETLPVPRTKDGKPRRHYVTNVERMGRALRAGDWAAFVGCTLVERARAGEQYDRVDVPDAIGAFVDEAWVVARQEVALRMARRSHALGRFAELYAEALERRRTALGAYEFDDITRLLGGPDPLGARADLYYRLDARTKHVLLDEFQDTSVPQWTAIEPLADELLSGHEEERGALIVADPKQSIYGWRGGTPDLVRHLRDTYALELAKLDRSWRSSEVVLEFVNDVHMRLGDVEVWGREEAAESARYVAVARDWLQDYSVHRPAKELPGYVELRIGPEDEESGEARPRLMRFAAMEVRRLLQDAPGRSIGVLTRTNAAVARMMLNLKDLGIHASEEGGNALTDAAPVVAILALLRMCDNPGNMVARYHVARTPLGAAIGYTDHTDTPATLLQTSALRRRLLDDGYGATVTAVADRLRPAADAREQRRLAQLGELAFRFDSHATLRPSDFVSFVRHERVEDPVAATVRVMTVHQAKGLEFDIVLLPELDAPMVQGRYSDVLAYRASPGAPVTRAFPYVGKALRALFPAMPELEQALEQAFRNELRDGLSTMYVALTRAKHALHIIAKPNQGNGRTGARTILRALVPEHDAFSEGQVVLQCGQPEWHELLRAQEERERQESPADAEMAASPVPPLTLRLGTSRLRALPRRSPSQLEGGGRVDLGMILRLSPAAARGSIAHRWFEAIGWLEDGTPADDELRALAVDVQTSLANDEVDALIREFRGWLEVPKLARLLSRSGWQRAAEVEREVPFITRSGDVLVEGFIDRLVITREAGRVVGAAVIDFKTDAVKGAGEVQQRAAHYRPQIDAYRSAVCGMYGLPAEQVEGWLVFVEAGEVVQAGVT